MESRTSSRVLPIAFPPLLLDFHPWNQGICREELVLMFCMFLDFHKFKTIITF